MFLVEHCKSRLGEDNTAYIMMLISSVFWVIGLMLGAQNHLVNFTYICVARSIYMIVLNYCVANYYNLHTHFYKDEELNLTKRTILMTLYSVVTTFSLKFIQAPTVHTISNTGAIFVFIIDHFKNNMAISGKEKAGLVFAIFGVVLAVNSTAIMNLMGYSDILTSKFQYTESTIGIQILISFILLVSVIGRAYAVVITKDLKKTNVFEINIYFAYGLLLSGALLNFQIPNTGKITIVEGLWVIFTVGGLLTFGTVLFIGALKTSKKSGNLTLMGFFQVIIGYLISLIRYGEFPNIVGILGSGFILMGLISVF